MIETVNSKALVIEYFTEKFNRVRNRSMQLCTPLQVEDFVVQPVVDVSPPKWHLGHTTWFFENFILVPNAKNYPLYDKDFSYLFNSYYESVGERVLRHNRGFVTRPGVEEVMRYREHVDRHMCSYLSEVGEMPSELAEVMELGLQHEQQHQELLVYDIKAILGNNPLFPAYLPFEDLLIPNGRPLSNRLVEIPEGVYEIGHEDNENFAFDNEVGVHKTYLHAYALMDRLVTNGEYLEFMEDGGYQDFRYWLSEGWGWVNEQSATAPGYWHKQGQDWYCYQLKGGLRKVDLSAPITHINYYEADAYATWKGKRLPTEQEWEVAAKHGLCNTLKQANMAEKGNFGPIAARDGNSQLFGDVWEWTGSAYLAYPRFKVAEGALGEYNGKFMINQMVLRGGSCATPKDHIRLTYRNFFHPHLKWLFAGIRLAESL